MAFEFYDATGRTLSITPGPPSGAAGGALAGSYPNPSLGSLVVTDANVALANKDGSAGVAGMRTLGAGALQAAAGNHTHTVDGSAATPSLRTLGTGALQSASGADVATLFAQPKVLYDVECYFQALGSFSVARYAFRKNTALVLPVEGGLGNGVLNSTGILDLPLFNIDTTSMAIAGKTMQARMVCDFNTNSVFGATQYSVFLYRIATYGGAANELTYTRDISANIGSVLASPAANSSFRDVAGAWSTNFTSGLHYIAVSTDVGMAANAIVRCRAQLQIRYV
jgi:hypothetical protein